MKCIKFTDEEEKIKDFLSLPNKIYSKNNNTENKKEVKSLLENNHPLSKYFNLDKFIVYKGEQPVGRFVITTYPNDKTAYIGFFECLNNKEIARFLFQSAYDFCKNKKYKSIIGPVDASFWIKYRLKINMFDKVPYTGEPYNTSYYQDLFLDNNYHVIHHYTSNIYKEVEEKYDDKKYSDRYKEFIKCGYKIISPSIENYEKVIEEIYYLLTELYRDFPIYKDLSLEDFQSVFKDYKKIINTSMVKLGYYKNKLVGFFISIPNYNNSVYHLENPLNILKILNIKKKPKEYVMLYMGVDQKHKGLGKALVESIMIELRKNHLPSIGALARDGKITQKYVDDLIEKQYEYILLEREIK